MRRVALAVLLAAACAGGPRSPYVRVVHESGRVYYAHVDKTLHLAKPGVLTFRDVVTREEVSLDDGTYRAQECPPEEVRIRQREYIENPSRLPGEGEEVPR